MDNDFSNRPEQTGDRAARIAGLSPAKRALLEIKLKKNGSDASGQQSIPRGANRDTASLSFAQQRLWFLAQLEPDSAAYNIHSALRLSGALNVGALQKSLDAIVARHEVLRTTFARVDGVPVQTIAASRLVELEVIDLSQRAAAKRDYEVQSLLDDRVQRPFNLSSDLMLRAALVRLEREEHILLLVTHHIASDGWSSGILSRELSVLYEAFSAGKPSRLSDLPIQYADFAIWQRQWLQGTVLEEKLSYWRKQLDGAPPLLELPTDRPRPVIQTFRGDRKSLVLSKSLTDAIKKLGRQEGTTLFMTLLGAFQTLLYRHTGQDDIVVGTPIAGRNRAEIEALIGFFVNTLVLRTDLSGNPSFHELLVRVRRMALDAYAHQDLPFEKLVEELRPERDVGRTPLFQVFFNTLNFEGEKLQLSGLRTGPLLISGAESKFDLTLYVREQFQEIHIRLAYNTDLFFPERMVRMLDQFEQLLVQIVHNPNAKIGSFTLLTPASKKILPDPTEALRFEWAGSVHEQFSRQALKRPKKIAVLYKEAAWTYAELNSRANQLAHYLRNHGVRSGDVIAISGHRSPALIWALLGILKAGAAFAILDPAYPPSRLMECLRVAKPRAWIQLEAAGSVSDDLKEFLNTCSSCCQLELPSSLKASSRLMDYPMDDPEVSVGPDDLAYVAFTSGSTGEPKAILGTHGPLSHFLQWHSQTFCFDESDRFSFLSGVSYDPALRDIFTPLWSGATLCVPDPEEFNSPGYLTDWMKREKITVAHMTPPMVQLMADIGSKSAVHGASSLHYVFFGGDTLTKRDVSTFEHLFSSATCINFYGATETPQAMGYFIIPKQNDDVHNEAIAHETIPLGRGIEGVQLLLLNDAGQLAGIGELGEIHVRTPYLARGYAGDDALTQQKFITNPFTGIAGDRIFKTGDKGRYLPDGHLDFAGRRDHQVKVRGFRIELGEIESALMQHPEVRNSAVLAREDAPGDKRLVAYVVAQQESAPRVNELKSFLKQKLPEYMVPTAYVFVDALPLTPNGKVDRKTLPAPDQGRPEIEEGFVAPRSFVEEMIAEIWAEVLKLQRVGVHDNFFDLGGHSLLATQVKSRISQVFAVEIPLRALFERPTVAQLAGRIEEARGEEQGPAAPPIVAVSRDKELPLSFSQLRLWFLDHYEPNSSVYNIPSALRLKGSLNVRALEQSLDEIIRRHESLRTTFSMVDGEPVQVIAPSVRIAVDVVDLRDRLEAEREDEARRLIREEAGRPFDLAQGPLFRNKLLWLGEDNHILLLAMHHIVSDGWSMGVLYRELTVLYRSFVKGEPSPLAELPIQYADFAVWQREWLQGEVLGTQLSYWKKQLAGIPEVLNLPTDRPRPAVQSYKGARKSIQLSRELSEGLKALSRKEGVTSFMTLLAAFQTLLNRYTGQKDIVVGSPIANRNRSEIERLIGFFVNTLILRSNFSDNPTFKELLAKVKETTLGAYAHQDLPFEKLVEVLQPKRHASHRSLIQVAFAFQNVPRQPLTLSELTVSRLQTPLALAKLDLTLFMWEADEGLAGSLDYATDLFDDATIGRVREDFQTLLEAVVADPNRRLVDLPCFPALAAKTAEVSPQEKLDVYENSNLTKNQLLIWAGQKLQPDVPLYNVVSAYTLTGNIDPGHFEKAFQTLLNSSDVLRTVIQEVDEVPQQKVLAEFPYELEYLDFSRDSEPRASFQTWLQARCRVQFNLEEHLFDCALAKITDSQFVWYLNQHHIITDGWSNSLIFRWMSEFYQRSLEGRLEPRIKLPPFQDYIDYEREFRTSPHYLEAANYWQRKLAEEFEPVNFYGKTPLKRTSQVRRISYDLGNERTQNLKRLAAREEISGRTEHASMFYIFAALLFTYLYRATGNRHLSIGTPYHNRSSKAFRDTLGLIMEVLPLRTTIEENDTFVSLIQKIRFEASQVFRYSQTIANSPQNKVYDVVLNYHTAAFPMFGGASAQREWVHTGYENDSLALQIHDFAAAGCLVLDFDFHCDVFSAEQRAQAMQHFVQVLDAFLEDSTQRLHRVNLLSPEEREQILVEFNHTGAALPNDQTIPQLFEAQVQNKPDQLAVVFEGQSLTYGQLNARANQLAHHLHSLGVGPEFLVGIYVEPSLEMIVGILGILKAGGAYLPLDPAYPRKRLSFMLQDAQVPVLLTHDRLLGDLPEYGGRVVCLDTDWGAMAGKNEDNPASAATADMAAYVIYTSGSTGKAKGVTIQHSGICHRLLWGQRFYRLQRTDRVLQKSSFAYDASVWEIFEPLLAGAQVVMARPGGRQDSAYLVELMAEEKVSVAEFVPSMIRVLLEEKGIERCSSLKRVFSGGEALSAEIRDRFAARLSSELYNTYGPTEASIDVAHFKCRPGTNQWTVPIGRPIANTQIYILDSHLNPVPIGLPGELHIGGIGLARGYLNRPELTAEKFIPNPFSDASGARLYKTGDWARYLPDGNIEFLGRIDHQVKIRGFRIELDEIEAVLKKHPAVREAVVLAREEIKKPKSAGSESKLMERLVAYLVNVQEPAPTTTELRSFLKDKLPGYMLPSAFVFLKALPLTASGKVNRQALPAPDPMRPELEGAFVPPRTPTESIMAKIWRELLGVDRVGVHDDFFDLGGHSLLAVRLFARIEKELRKKLPLASLFERATIEHLSSLIAEPTPSSGLSSLVAIQPQGSKLPFFCVHEFFGDVFCYVNLARRLGNDQPFYALQPLGLDGTDEPLTDVAAMAAYYIGIIRTVQPRGPYALGGLCFGGVIALEMAQQLRAKGEPVGLVALLDSGIRLNYGSFKWWWHFFQNLPLDLRSWLTGSLQLTSGQWLDVVRIKSASAKWRLANLFHPSTSAGQQHGVPGRLKRLGDVFQFSERHQRIARAQYRALKSYEPRRYTGRLTLFRARMQPFFSSHDPHKGWSRIGVGGVEVRNIPGNHLGMLQEPHVQVLARELGACLESAGKVNNKRKSQGRK